MNVRNLLINFHQELQQVKFGDVSANLINTGFSSFDNKFNGLKKGELVLIAGRPGMGRLSFMTSLLINLSFKQDGNCYFGYTLTSIEEILVKLVSNYLEINNKTLYKKSLAKKHRENIQNFVNDIIGSETTIEKIKGNSLEELSIQIKKFKAESNIEIAFIDSVNELKTEKEIDLPEQYIFRQLKEIAVDLNICIVIGSQLTREVEFRGSSRIPEIKDLVGSSFTEEIADKIILIYRWDYYGLTEDFDGNPTDGVANIIIAKNNSGSTETIEMSFSGEYSRFEDLEVEHFEEETEQN